MDRDELTGYIADEGMLVVEAMQRIDENNGAVLYITDSDGRLVGSLSDGDIRRWIIRSGDIRATVTSAMRRNVHALRSTEVHKAEECMVEYTITSVPILDENGKIVDIYFDKAKRKRSDTIHADLKGIPIVIMAGGEGTRLYPYTKILPKPLIPIDGVPILERIMNRFAGYGAEDFYLVVNYRREMIKSYFNDIKPGYRIHYIDEDKPLGTAGGLRLIDANLGDTLIVTNCDTLIRAEYDKILDQHRAQRNRLTIVSSLKKSTLPYGVLEVEEDGVVTALREKPTYSNLVNTGMYVLDSDILERIPEGGAYHMTDLISSLMSDGEQVGMYPVSENSFLDMGEFEEMQRMEEQLNGGNWDDE